MSAPTPTPIRLDAEVRQNRPEGPASYRLVLHVPGWPGSEPGQFAMLSPGPRRAATVTDPLLPRPMAVYRYWAQRGGADVEILYKVSGRGTSLLAGARPGDAVGIVGPLGRPFPAPSAGPRAVMVGGGTGIASLWEIAARATRVTDVLVLLGARTAEDLMGLEDFESLGVQVRIATEDGTRGERGLVTALLESTLDAPERAVVYACGPTPMMRRAAEIAAEKGMRCLVSLENTMACGFGVCLGCAVPRAEGGYALVCREGPVFDAASVGWDGLP